jgi:hypothetical protein
MKRGARWYLVGSCLLLLGLAGCARMWFAEREPWRREAEVACLKSGAVKEGPSVAILQAIDGPGSCGADYPLRVAALGAPAIPGFADEPMRPPGAVTGAAPAAPDYARTPTVPAPYRTERSNPPDAYPGLRPLPATALGAVQPGRPERAALTIAPAAVGPAATLACPMVSALNLFVSEAVQPAALRWFGQPVAELRQISSYSCRGMNGDPSANISEHAFGNALDIAAFTLADGHKITVKDGWHGTPEEQGFLHDVQGAACERFATVLAPGSNAYHEDNIHVDLMRRGSGRVICQPAAIPGEVAAARAAPRYGRAPAPSYAGGAVRRY